MKKAKNNSSKQRVSRKFQIDIRKVCGAPINNKKISRLIKRSLLGAYHKICISVSIVDELEAKNLNQRWREKDYATNVLSFALSEGEKCLEMERILLGDLVFCDAIIAKEAAEQGKDILAHYAHLLIHGMLHLQGYDHLTEDEAKIMELTENKLMEASGYSNPYN